MCYSICWSQLPRCEDVVASKCLRPVVPKPQHDNTIVALEELKTKQQTLGSVLSVSIERFLFTKKCLFLFLPKMMSNVFCQNLQKFWPF